MDEELAVLNKEIDNAVEKAKREHGMAALQWEVTVLVFLFGLAQLVVFATPAIGSNGSRDAQRSEGESLLGALKDRVRVYCVRQDGQEPVLPSSLTRDVGLNQKYLTGDYYIADDEVLTVNSTTFRISARSTTGRYDVLYLECDYLTGENEFSGGERIWRTRDYLDATFASLARVSPMLFLVLVFGMVVFVRARAHGFSGYRNVLGSLGVAFLFGVITAGLGFLVILSAELFRGS